MRNLVLKMSITLDGFVCGPNGEMDWVFRHRGPESTAWTVAQIAKAGVHIMGARTFQDMAAFWPRSTEVFASAMNTIPKVVFSSKGVLPSAASPTVGLGDALADRAKRGEAPAAEAQADVGGWRSARVASGDLATEIARLKAEPGGPILAHGGARFARSLVASGLVDEYSLAVFPVALGRGQALFSDLARPVDLRRVEATPFPNGVVGTVLRPG